MLSPPHSSHSSYTNGRMKLAMGPTFPPPLLCSRRHKFVRRLREKTTSAGEKTFTERSWEAQSQMGTERPISTVKPKLR